MADDLVAHLLVHTGHEQPRGAGVPQIVRRQISDAGATAHTRPGSFDLPAAGSPLLGIGPAEPRLEYRTLTVVGSQIGERHLQLRMDRHTAVLATPIVVSPHRP